jgi:hypothetical protein
MKMRNALIAIAAVGLMLAAAGCDVMKKNIATKGPQRYKAEVAAVLQDAKEQLDNDGKLKPATKKKLDTIIAKWEPEFKVTNSMVSLKEAQTELNAMDTDPNNSFKHKDQAMYKFQEALRSLETEVGNE